MKRHELKDIGVPNSCLDLATEYCSKAAKGGLFKRYSPSELVGNIIASPQDYFRDSLAGRFAKGLAADAKLVNRGSIPYKVWGEDQIELGALDQLRAACTLPVAYGAALMPDAHLGYGLPIGGVFATVNSVIPYAVGVDIACRMKLTVFDIPATELENRASHFEEALLKRTIFGAGQEYGRYGRRKHDVMDKDWNISPVTKILKDKAWSQLGTSGGGNHFVEFGTIIFNEPLSGIEVGKLYVALLSHSGSRGPGAKVCQHYHRLAQKQCDTSIKHLSWLDLGTQEGQEYWDAMNLMGDYASANHDVIHQQVSKHIGGAIALQIENHHNFAWKEIHGGVEVIVHRKGATPAHKGVLGVIPGSMADPAFVVRGKGNADSLMSASHGAGRRLSRTKAKQTLDKDYWKQEIKDRGVKLLSAGIDEVPAVYKNIEEVMLRQADLVETIARFDPKIVRMADDGSAED
jgi:tRNA-splicing ligase RtcB